MSQIFHQHTCSNGLVIIGESMPHVSSVSVSLLVSVGAAVDPKGKEGCSNILVEMFSKGAGKWNAQELSQEFENLGIQRSSSSGIEVSVFSIAMLPEKLANGLTLLKTMVLEPTFPSEELESIKSLALQDLKALEDEPASLSMHELSKDFYPAPFNSSQIGTEQGINQISIEDLKNYYQQQFLPSPGVIAVAGKFNWPEVVSILEKQFTNWSGTKERLKSSAFSGEAKLRHISRETSQVQIALAYPSVTYGHRDFYTAKVANGVLSGGMAGRLFIEVREKRGLVYSVSSSHSSSRLYGGVFASAGTTPENAQETFDVMLREITNLKNGVESEELKRSKADLKSRIVMQSELSTSRVSSLINDWWNLGKIRTVEEIKKGVDQVTSEDIVRYCTEFPASPLTLITLGSKSVELSQ